MSESTAKDKELIEQLITKEAEVNDMKRQIAEYNKRLKDIQKSRTYRLGIPFEKISQFFAKLFRREQARTEKIKLQSLERELITLKQQLEAKEEELYYLKLDERSFKTHEMMEQLRTLKETGKILDYITNLSLQKEEHIKNYNEALTYAARLFMQEDPEKQRVVYEKVLPTFQTDEIPEFLVRPGLEESFSLEQVGSFRGSLTRRIRQRQLSETELPEYLLEDKLIAYQFIDQLNIRRPKTIATNKPFDEIPMEPKSVIKPVDGAGSRGVYLIYDEEDIIDVKRGEKLTSLNELEEHMAKDLATGWVAENNWLAEELVVEDFEKKIPARDLKFYSFYGKVGLILEITRYPELRQCWWTRDGKRIRTGKYEEQLFKGDGVTEEEIAFIEQLSKKIPAPFVRIDFLKSEEGLIFGEFTAKPGNYDDFNEQIDRQLGDYYLEAEINLTNDLFSNKQFNEFNQFLRSQQLMK